MKKIIMMIVLMMCFVGSVLSQTSGVIYSGGKRYEASDIKFKNDEIVYHDQEYIFEKWTMPLTQVDSVIYYANYNAATGYYTTKKLDYYSPKVFKTAQDYEIYIIHRNLNKMHREYSTGTTLILCGLLASSSGIAYKTFGNTNDTRFANTLTVIGGALSLTGYILQVDSHKYLKRASVQYSVSPVSASLNIKF